MMRHEDRLIAVAILALCFVTQGFDPIAVSAGSEEHLARAEAVVQGQPFNQAVEFFVVELQRELPLHAWSGSYAIGQYIVTFAGPEKNAAFWSTSEFDALIPASDVPERQLRSRVVTRGAGVPFVGYRAATGERYAAEPFFARGQTVAPVTVTLDFQGITEDGRRAALVRVWNPMSAGAEIASDLSAPLEFMTQQMPEGKLARLGFFNPNEYASLKGLFVPVPYQPGKIPVVMVHGLDSLARTWQDTYNELLADPLIRTRYQFWFYRYPTGEPVAVSSVHLRDSLQAARSHFDPKHRDKALNRMVLVGHSMGGLLSRMMVTESGDVLWRTMSGDSLEDANLPDADRAFLREIAFFHPQPFITRVVFICTPHRGSTLASGSLGQLADKVVKTPVELVGLSRRVAMQLPSGLSSRFGDLVKDMPTSIDNLSPNNPFLLALQNQPIHVPHHSIIGTRGVTKGGKPLSDGVVPYWSAHLETAESEAWINSDHSAHQHPEAISELRRILLLHLGGYGFGASNSFPCSSRRTSSATETTSIFCITRAR